MFFDGFFSVFEIEFIFFLGYFVVYGDFNGGRRGLWEVIVFLYVIFIFEVEGFREF